MPASPSTARDDLSVIDQSESGADDTPPPGITRVVATVPDRQADPMEPFAAPLRFLADTRRELARVARAEVVFAALIVVALALVLGFGLAVLLGTGPGRWGWVPLGLGAGAIGFVIYFFGVRPGRARRNDAELALWVEAKVPGLDSGLVTAVQTAAILKRSADAAGLGFSPALAEAAALRSGAALKGVDVRLLPDRTRLSRLRWAALGAASAVALVALLAPGFYAQAAHNLTNAPPDEGQDGRLVDVAVSQLELEVKSPVYTQLKPRRIQRSVGDVEALVGSEVRFTGTTLFPAKSAALVLESDPEARWMVELEADGTLRGSFKVGTDDRYQFVLIDGDGELVRERAWRKVSVRADAPPEVTLLLPESDLEVKPDTSVGFFFEASDDLGLEKVELVVEGDQGKELQRSPVSAPKGSRLDKGDATVEVAKLGLEPGQSAVVYFEVFDQNDISGPGKGKSQSRKLTLYSPQDEHDQLLSQLKALIEKMLDVLADRLESQVDKGRPDLVATFAEAQMGMMSATQGILMELERLSGGFSTDPLATDALRDGLREVRDAMGGVFEQERAQLAKWTEDRDLVDPKVFVTLLAQSNEESSNVLEQGILKLKRLLDGALKDAILEAGREMLETQNEMMDILKELKEKNDPAAREAALKKLQKLQQKLKELQQKLAKLQERSPYENQNPAQRPSDKQEEAKDMQSQMDQIQKLLEEGKVDEAMKLLEELSKSTQEMMAGLQEDLDQIGNGPSNPGARRAMQEMKQALDELADGQRQVQRETGSTGDNIDERQRKELMDKAKAQLGEMKDEAKAIREALKGAKKDSLHPDDKAALDKLEKAAEGLEQAIENAKLGEARGKASDVSGGSEGLSGEIGESESRELDKQRLGELREAMKNLNDAAAKAKALGEKLGGMEPKPGEGLSPGEKQGLEGLEKSQGQLEERLKQLKEKLAQMEGDAPGMQDAMEGALEGAGKAMGEAKQELNGKKPKGAQGKQQEALEKLQEAQQSLDEMMKQQQQNGGQTEDQTGVNDPKAKVGIPKDDPYASPRLLREEILRAMQEKAPDAYKDAIRKFYEELTK